VKESVTYVVALFSYCHDSTKLLKIQYKQKTRLMGGCSGNAWLQLTMSRERANPPSTAVMIVRWEGKSMVGWPVHVPDTIFPFKGCHSSVKDLYL
jgi:hypothetical protein